MGRTFKQSLITLFFIGQLVAVWALNRDWGKEPDSNRNEALPKYGFYLDESAQKCGIDFKHESPTQLDKKLEHILPIIASMGASVTVVDFNRDGWPDFYVVTSIEGGKNRLYRNNKDGTFTDVAEQMGIADLNRPGTGVCQGAVWGDFDNDGYEDLLVYKWGKPELFRNDGGKRFVSVTDKSGLPAWINANSACWLDYDGDGKLDLFIAGYWGDDVDLWNLKTEKMMPDSFKYANNGGRKYLLRNVGSGTFEDVTKKVGIRSTRWTLGVQAADLCGSGYPDIVLANDYGPSEFFRNRAGKDGREFVEEGEKTGIAETPKSGMNVSFGDIYNDDNLAIYITNITEPGNLVQGNNLWVPQPHKPGEAPKYINAANQAKVELGGWSWGAQFGDLNNDGRLDLYLTNGYISAGKESYWFDFGIIAGAHKSIITDAHKWPTIGNRSLSGYQQKCVWWNRGGEFADIATSVGVKDRYDGRSVAMADLFNRGVLDVLVANQNGPLLLYKNTVKEGRDQVHFELEGTKRNRSAIGALVRVFWTMKGADHTQEQVQVVSGGNGYAAQNMRRLHYGLGENAKIEKVVIQWPSGHTQTLESPKVNMLHKVQESSQ
jgi:enediyne biosynthesis protein E4